MEPTLVSTGIAGLDDILYGGLPPCRQYLIEGTPGTGKTTLAIQFLLEGKSRGEQCLYVTLSESRDELQEVAVSHAGNSTESIEIYELEAAALRLKPEDNYTVFRPEEVELNETVRAIYSRVERIRPARAVIDSLSELRLLARDPLRFRREILALKQFFAGRNCTLLLLDDRPPMPGRANLSWRLSTCRNKCGRSAVLFERPSLRAFLCAWS